MARPKEPERVILTAHVLPETDLAVRLQVIKSKREVNTLGKVIDRKFGNMKKK